jgi:hypothetical protein
MIANATDGGCSERGCANPIKARGLCALHYARFIRTGSADLKPVSAKATCTVADCNRVATARGLCHKHYERMHRTGMLDLPPVPVTRCSFEGCGKPTAARGLCATHYMRWSRRGSPDTVLDTHGRPLICDAPPAELTGT